MKKTCLFFVFAFMLSSVSLWAAPGDTLRLGNCEKLPSNLYKRTQLKCLIVVNSMGYCTSPIKELGPELQNLKNLEVLHFQKGDEMQLNHHKASSYPKLPAAIASLPQLKELNTNSIVPEIFQIKSLEYLQLRVGGDSTDWKVASQNSFAPLQKLKKLYLHLHYPNGEELTFPDLDQLKALETVHLSGAGPETVKALLTLPNLKTLTLDRCTQVSSLDFGVSKSLEQVYLSNCQLSEFPASLLALKNLTHLGLAQNQIQTIPNDIYRLKKLEELGLSQNQISGVPEEIGKLRNLKSLNLIRNQIQEIPTTIAKCNQLETLFLGGNPDLKEIPAEIGNLRQLKQLDGSYTALSTLPESLGQLSNLEYMAFTHCQLRQLPEDWSSLQKLKKLNISHNQLSKLPASMGLLSTLVEWHINDNQIEVFPPSVKAMKSLVSLEAHRNHLKQLAEDIGQLDKLETFSLYNNHLESLPASTTQMQRVRQFYVGNNRLTSLPSGMKYLNKVDALEIQHNPLSIPDEIFFMPSLERIWISKGQKYNAGVAKRHPGIDVILTD